MDYCNVMTAVTDGNTETEAAADKVTGQIVIYLLDPLTVQEQDGSTDVDETGAAAENTDAGTANSGSTETGSGFAGDGADAESTATDTAADADAAADAADDGFEDGTEGGAQ